MRSLTPFGAAALASSLAAFTPMALAAEAESGVELELELAPAEEAAAAEEDEPSELDTRLQTPDAEMQADVPERKDEATAEPPRKRIIQPAPKLEEQPAPAEEPAMEEMNPAPTSGALFEPAPSPLAQVGAAIMDAPVTDFGAAVTVGGGVTNFTQSNLNDATSAGGYWDVRGSLGTRSIVGVEAAYHGNSRDIAAIGLRDETFLVGNGLEGALRLNAPLTFEQNDVAVLVEPFAFGGIGWTRYNLFNEGTNTSSVLDQDDVFVLPVGVGIAGSVQGVMLDARFTYRPAFGNDLVGSATGAFDNDSLSDWSLGAHVGFEF